MSCPMRSSTQIFVRRKIQLFCIVLMLPLLTVHAQFLDEISNPTVKVSLVHPPSLGLMVEKVAFGPTSGQCADQVVDAIITDFVRNDVDVIDRANLNAILAEHDFSFSGYVDKTTAAAIGKIIGPSALIFVKVRSCSTKVERLYDKEVRHNYKTNTNYTVRVYVTRTRAFLTGSIQTVDLATGRIFAAQTFDYMPEKSFRSYDGWPEAPPKSELMQKAIVSAAWKVHCMFFPWKETRELYYYDDKKCGMREAFDALASGDQNRSFSLMQTSLNRCKNDPKTKDKVLGRAYYNLGMNYLIRGDFDEALECFYKTTKLRPGNIVNQAITDCNKAKQLQEQLQEVEETAAIEAENRDTALAQAAQQHENNTLRNQDILELAQKQIPEKIILHKIKSSECAFDTSPDAIIALTDGGVSEEVIIAMMER